ncbi:phosphate transport system ATP-binding protein, partial [Candidatus Hakubella thermalkaliphila]
HVDGCGVCGRVDSLYRTDFRCHLSLCCGHRRRHQPINCLLFGNSVAVEDLSVWFGRHQVLKNVSLYAQPREVTALIGPSGCGKTTLLRCINRLHDLYSNATIHGKIMVGTENILGVKVDPVELRRRVGMIFQKPNPFPHLSIFENVAAGLRLPGLACGKAAAERVEACLRKAALWEEVKDSLDRPGTMLSGGQQQRLCIARALAIEPAVFLM